MTNNEPINNHVLTEKDIQALSFVYQYDGVTTDLILRAHYPAPSARSYGYSRVNRLVRGHFLNRTRLPSLNGVGSGQAFFTLGVEGRKALAQARDVPRTSIARQETPVSLFFIAHHLQTCAVRLMIAQATTAPQAPATLVDWKTERELRAHPFKVRANAKPERILIPDAYLVLRTKRGEEAEFCLETDMGTLSKRRWAEKIDLYNHSPHRAVLVTVPNANRKDELVELTLALASQQKKDPSRFWFADIRDLNHNTILTESVWYIPGIGTSSLVPNASYDAQKSNHNAPRTTAHPPAIINVSISSSGGGEP